MTSFQINGQDPPRGAMPRQPGYTFHLPRPVDSDSMGRPMLNNADLPWVEINFQRLDQESWNWYIEFLASHKMYGQLSSIRLLNPFQYTVPAGPEWVTYSGDSIYLHQPMYDAIDFGNFFGVRIEIRGLA